VQSVLAAFSELDSKAAGAIDQRPAVPAVIVNLPFLEERKARERVAALGPHRASDCRRRVRAARERERREPERERD